jgi:hypothetical protein
MSFALVNFQSNNIYTSDVLSQTSIQIHGKLKYFLKIINEFRF